MDKAIKNELVTISEDLHDLVVDGRPLSSIRLSDSDIVAEGKSKKFYQISDRVCFMMFKPHLRSVTNKREESIEGTDASRLLANMILMNVIEKATGVGTHLLYNETVTISGMSGMLVSPAKTIPIEFIKRYYAEGSIVRLFPSLVTKGQKLETPLSKYDFKQDVAVAGIDDPTLNESYITGLGLLTEQQFKQANEILDKTADALNNFLYSVGIKLIDFKMEIGFAEGEMVIIDEITQDCIRANLIETDEPLTKDVFRQMKTPEEVCEAYKRFNKLIML